MPPARTPPLATSRPRPPERPQGAPGGNPPPLANPSRRRPARRVRLPLVALPLVASSIAALLPFAGTAAAASPEETARAVPRPFPEPSLSRWQERSFDGATDYRLVEEDGVAVLRGRTDGAASILYRERRIDLERTPFLEWSWKVDRVYTGTEERTRGGDDFPARLYVVVRTGLLPWQTLAINYVWAAEAAPGERWPNPFTDKAVMIAVRSGAGEVGRWMHERRDVAADFRDAFGERVTAIDGYAVMVDGDNGDRAATAWFGELGFAAE